jgi:Flp pilus assembly pilin Flp
MNRRLASLVDRAGEMVLWMRGCSESVAGGLVSVAGQSTVEYALVGALVVIAAAGALTMLGGEIGTVFSRITATLSGSAAPPH